MNIVFPLKLAKDNQCGLCNQLYALTGCIDHGIFTRAYHIIILDSFLKEIGTEEVCPASEILNLDKINAFLKPYDIRLIDKHTHIKTQMDMVEFFPSPQLYFGGSQNPPLFVEILKNISFCDSFLEKNNQSMDTLFNTWIPMFENMIASPRITPKFNIVHLRLEDDAILSFSRFLHVDKEDFKKRMERKYIDAIQKYIHVDDYTLVIASDYDNEVMTFLETNGYNYKTTQKEYRFRELNAIHDLLYARYCSNVFIGVYESSYSYTVMYRIFKESYWNVKAVILKITEIEKPASVFDKYSAIHNIRNG